METQTETEKQTKVYEVLVCRDARYTCWVEARSKEEAERAVWNIDHNCPTHFDGDTVVGVTVVEDADPEKIDITYGQIVAERDDRLKKHAPIIEFFKSEGIELTPVEDALAALKTED